jgi:hypothetical protein
LKKSESNIICKKYKNNLAINLTREVNDHTLNYQMPVKETESTKRLKRHPMFVD